MNLNSFLLLNICPSLFELFLHFSPNVQRLSLELSYLVFSRSLELIETELSLNDCGLLHQEFQLRVGTVSLETSPVLLNVDRS